MHTGCRGDACSKTYDLCQNARSNMDSTTEITTSDPPVSVSSSSIPTSAKLHPTSSCPSCPACTDSPTCPETPTCPTCPECPRCQTINGQVYLTAQPLQHPSTTVNTLTSQTRSQPPDNMTTLQAVFTTMDKSCIQLVTATIATYGKCSPLYTSTLSWITQTLQQL